MKLIKFPDSNEHDSIDNFNNILNQFKTHDDRLKIIAAPELNDNFDFKKEKKINKLSFSGKRKISMNINRILNSYF
jgi:hypothetical protein